MDVFSDSLLGVEFHFLAKLSESWNRRPSPFNAESQPPLVDDLVLLRGQPKDTTYRNLFGVGEY